MSDPVSQISHEPHIFRLSLSFQSSGPTKMIVVSYDGSIVYIMDADHWINEFKSGESRIYVKGHFDLLDGNIYLGDRIEGLSW